MVSLVLARKPISSTRNRQPSAHFETTAANYEMAMDTGAKTVCVSNIVVFVCLSCGD